MLSLRRFARHPAARLTGALVGACALAALLVRPVGDPSPWLHLRVGQYLAGGGRFGLPDPFTASAEHAYVPTQWLPSVLCYELVERLGVPAVAWLRVMAVLALVAVQVCLLRHRVRPAAAVMGGLAAGLLVLAAMTERPQTAGLVLLALTVLGWSRSAADGRPRWWLVPLAWVFAMTHGLWAIGLVVGVGSLAGLALDGAGRSSLRRLVPVLALEVLATLLTPLGPALVLTPFTVGDNGRRFVEEWQPGSLTAPLVVVVLLLESALVVVVLRRGQRLRRSELLTLALGLVLAASAVRTAAPAVLVVLPVLADHLLRRDDRVVPRPSALPLLVVLVVTAAAAAVALPVAILRARVPQAVPAGLSAAVADLPRGAVVLSQTDVSGWLMWTAPQVQPVVDLRVESFTPAHMTRYVSTYQARPGWEGLVDQSGASYALLPTEAPVAGALQEVRHWQVAGRADGYVLLRRGPS